MCVSVCLSLISLEQGELPSRGPEAEGVPRPTGRHSGSQSKLPADSHQASVLGSEAATVAAQPLVHRDLEAEAPS